MVRGGGSWTRHEGVIELSQVATARGPTSQRDDMLASLNSIVARLPRSKGTLETTLLGRRRLFSYSEVYEDIIRVRRYLFDRGLGPGSAVGLVAENGYEWILLDLACLSAGIVLVPFDPKVQEAPGRLVTHYQLDALFDTRCEACTDRISPLNVLVDQIGRTDDGAKLPPEYGADAFAPYQYEADSIVCMKFTSGTTSLPKGIPAKAGNIADCVHVIQRAFEHTADDRLLVFLPLYLLQQRYFLYSSILFDIPLIVVPYIQSFAAIESSHPTVVMAVPHFLETLYQRYLLAVEANGASGKGSPTSVFERVFGKRLRYLWTGSAPIQRELLDRFAEVGIPVYQGYGTAETGILTKNLPGNDRRGSVGKVLPGREIRLSPSGEILARNRTELNSHYCSGGVFQVGERFVDDDGFFPTGDLGVIDDDGFLFVTGRLKNLIVLPSGRKLHPEPIEAAFASHPAVSGCVVFGSKNGQLSAIVDSRLPAAEVAKHITNVNQNLPLEERLGRHLVIPGCFSDDSDLRNAQGKILRSRVCERFGAELRTLGVHGPELALEGNRE